MYIKEILDNEGYTADIVVTDGTYELICFYHHHDPDRINKKNIKIDEVTTFNFNKCHVVRVESKEFIIEKNEKDYYSYNKLQGELIDRPQKMIRIGGIIIKIGESVDSEIVEGEFVEFSVDRLDCDIIGDNE